MTYERAEVLSETIKKVFLQSKPPEKLLIVDNSKTDKTKALVGSLSDNRIEYMAVGYNSGPAGAAKIGLQKLTEEGFDWIYWGDDDDPPHFPDVFEKLLDQPLDTAIGLVGVTGNRFSRLSGQLYRVPQGEINQAVTAGRRWIEVDAIAGNQSMIVNAAIIKMGILPDPRLFFGFEELEFCLRVKKAGFKIIASSELFFRSREKFKRSKVRQPLYVPFTFQKLHRQYYSIRNGLFISTDHGLYLGLLLKTIKSLLKIITGFALGINYGASSARLIILALIDGWSGNLKTRKLPGK